MTERPYTDVAVIMRCERIDNRWQPWRWSLAEVVMHDPAFGTEPRQLLSDEREQRWMFPGFRVELFRDDAEGYHLNVESPARAGSCCGAWTKTMVAMPRLARPVEVSLSYHEAGPLAGCARNGGASARAAGGAGGAAGLVAENYQPEPKRRKRPDSFQPLQDRFGNPASVSTEKHRGEVAVADGFLGRWSRRKQEVREGKPVQDPAPPVPQAPVPAGVNAPAPLAAQPAAAPVPPEPAARRCPRCKTHSRCPSIPISSPSPAVRWWRLRCATLDEEALHRPHFNVMDGWTSTSTTTPARPAARCHAQGNGQRAVHGAGGRRAGKKPSAAGQAAALPGGMTERLPHPWNPCAIGSATGQDVAQSGYAQLFLARTGKRRLVPRGSLRRLPQPAHRT